MYLCIQKVKDLSAVFWEKIYRIFEQRTFERNFKKNQKRGKNGHKGSMTHKVFTLARTEIGVIYRKS